ncbi:J domain-containing protein [bacterium]|nr:J domain-containing protein [bacterium]
MRLNARQYRDQLYRLRAHPDSFEGFYDQRDSFTMVYLSVIPFGIAEYLVEARYDVIPSGLVFPIGFLLFWAFYYTYYKPGILEDRLTKPSQFNLMSIPLLVFGVLIWFVKVTLVELGHLAVFQWLVAKPAARPKPHAAKASAKTAPQGGRPAAPPPLLSPDLLEALNALGLKPGCSWNDIHRQYRTLAKQFHPDLNPDITDFGRRFIHLDAAYHKLAKVRSKHFPK